MRQVVPHSTSVWMGFAEAQHQKADAFRLNPRLVTGRDLPVKKPPPDDVCAPLQKAGTVSTMLLSAFAAKLMGALPLYKRPNSRLLPADWKIFARVMLGIQATRALNQTLNWSPPPWLYGVETVAILHTLTSSISRSSVKQLLVLAPITGALVQLGAWLNDRLTPEAVSHNKADPFEKKKTMLLKLGVAAGLIGLGLVINRQIAQKLFPRLGITEAALSNGIAGTCPKGCTPGGLICLSELGELVEGFRNNNQQAGGKAVTQRPRLG